MRTTRTTTTLAVVLALTLTGCGGEDEGDSGDRARTVAVPSASAAQAPQGQAAADETLTEAQLEAALLTVQDLPTGYTVATEDDDEDADDSDEATSTDAECATRFDELGASDTERASADVDFEGGLGVVLEQGLESYEDEDALQQHFDEVVDVLTDCPAFSDTADDGSRIEIAIGPLSFPKLGDDTVALSLSGSSGGLDVRLNMVVVRVGRTAMSLAQGGLAADAAVLEQAARTGVAKLEAAGA